MATKRDVWKSLMFEETTDYIEDDEDYVVISINKKTGAINQQYEYEYSLDRFLKDVSSLSTFSVLEDDLQESTYRRTFSKLSPSMADSLPLQTGCNEKLIGLGIRLDGKDEEESEGAGSTRSSSPHPDVDFKDLDAISDPESESHSRSTYTDTSEKVFSDMIFDKIPSSQKHCMELGDGVGGAVSKGERVKKKSIRIRRQNGGETERESQGEGLTDLGRGKINDDIERERPGESKALVLAATAHAVLIACLWVLENRAWVK
ncbi:hypothetical protein ACEPPN_013351 [Leptodophora sp. 'Broadleaf-Isolate-01']